MFALIHKDLKGIPLELAQCRIELNTSIPQAHQARYKLNLNYVATNKHDIEKLLAARFIQLIKEATWLSPIMNGNLKICVNFKKLNMITKNLSSIIF